MLRFAIRNLLSRPLRSLLALLGLSVAIVGMVGLFSVAEGLDELVESTFGRIPGLVAMQPGAPIPLFSRIPADWENDLERIPGVRVVNSEIWQRVNLIEGKMVVSPPRFLFGTDIESRLRLNSGVYKEDMVTGRFLTPQDVDKPHAVISRQIAEEFGKQVGDTLNVNGHDLNIIGIYHCGSLLLDVAIILDIDQVRAMTRFGNDAVSAFYIEQENATNDDELIQRIQDAFRGRNLDPWKSATVAPKDAGILNNVVSGLTTLLQGGTLYSDPKPTPTNTNETNVSQSESKAGTKKGSPPPIEVRSAADWAERFEDFSADLDIFLLIMSGIGVTIAVMSIINTMLMSVSERIIEFGILKANGWSRLDVMRLITFESALLGLGGGVFGAGVGWAATQVLNSIWPTRVHLIASPGLLSFAVAFSVALGILGGLYPAIWAMRMSPMEAIRK